MQDTIGFDMDNTEKTDKILSLESYKNNVLRFIERCVPSDGVFDEEAFKAAGGKNVRGSGSDKFIIPKEKRIVKTLTLKERAKNNYWAFSSTPGGVESIEGNHSAIEALYLLGELDTLTDEDKANWADYINSFQDEATGYYLGPYIPDKSDPSWSDASVNTHPWYHMHEHLIACLCPAIMLLGAKSKYKFSKGSMTGRYLDEDFLKDYLYNRDWNNYKFDLNFRRHNPWWMGNEFWNAGCILWQIATWEEGTKEGDKARKLLDEIWYKWHDENIGITGFWYGDLKTDKEKIWHHVMETGFETLTPKTSDEYCWISSPIMGSAHQLWLYAYENHDIPDELRKRQTDMILLLQRNDGLFGLRAPDDPLSYNDNTIDTDCMTLLAFNYNRIDYRREDIKKALKKAVLSIFKYKINDYGVLESRMEVGFGHNFNSVPTLSPANWGNMINMSFYFWPLICAFNILDKSECPELSEFIDHDWPQPVSHYLWFMKR